MRRQTDGLGSTHREVLRRWLAAHDKTIRGPFDRPVGHPKRQAFIRNRPVVRIETNRGTRRY